MTVYRNIFLTTALYKREKAVPAHAGKRQLKTSGGPFRPENDKSVLRGRAS
jgi:hypothetical protein